MDTVSSRIPSACFRLVLLLALSAGLVSGCTTPPGGTPATPPTLPAFTTAPTKTSEPAAPTGPLVAYRASTEIGVVDGTEIYAKASGNFSPSSEPLVTEDGRFVFAGSADGNLVTLDVRSKATRVIPLPQAARLGTAGGSTVVWWEQPNRLMQLDLANASAQPTLRQTADLPPVYGVSPPPEPKLLTARDGTAIVARVESTPTSFGGPDTLYAIRGNAPPTPLGTADANAPVADAVLSPDGASLVYALYRPSSNNCGTAAVVVSNADGSQQTFDVAAPGPATGSQVLRMWWQQAQPMSLSLATWGCDPPSSYSPRIWDLAPDRLVQGDPPTVALQAAEVYPGQRALIIPRGNPEPEASGTLVIEDSERRFPVKPDVDAIDVIPAPATG
ncbi:hypothetical protein [Mycobacterium sp. URHB0044]|uniref:hypothetical protein n=1 Tax=Mycobacterium sp. URHB0044 TaxID=1380386 RepID=UPI00055CFB8B|nr:hypothetical protein [Mycobacterium sp. URHB0044]